MILDFDKFAQKGNEFICDLEMNLGKDSRRHAARILKATFRVLRNHLSIGESLQLISQMPMTLKAVYVDGWTLQEHCPIRSLDEFLVEILAEDGNEAWRDFSNRNDILNAVKAVFTTLRVHINPDEVNAVLRAFPAEIVNTFAPLAGIREFDETGFFSFFNPSRRNS
jgi:uncharacterized protein (DUF2267 family)